MFNKLSNRMYRFGRRAIAPFIIISIILFVYSFKPLYYFEIHNLDIPKTSGLDANIIKENYSYIIDYTTSHKKTEFDLPSLRYSNEGKAHFTDVRRLIQFLMYLCLGLGLLSIVGVVGALTLKEYNVFRYIGMWLIFIPLLLFLPFSLNFSGSFELFHRIFFRNDYWIFDPVSDPVINILPEDFFMHGTYMILGLITLMSLSFIILYMRFRREFK